MLGLTEDTDKDNLAGGVGVKSARKDEVRDGNAV